MQTSRVGAGNAQLNLSISLTKDANMNTEFYTIFI